MYTLVGHRFIVDFGVIPGLSKSGGGVGGVNSYMTSLTTTLARARVWYSKLRWPNLTSREDL